MSKTAAGPARCLMASATLTMLMMAASLARDPNPYQGNPAPPPPEPNPVSVEVPRGRPVLITLSAYSLTSPIIRFRIRRGAESGQVGVPRMATASTAVVRYKPPAGAGPGEDSFTYAVQSAAGFSAPATVRIKITDSDPDFVAPVSLDFGRLLPGESAKQTLTLENIGGGVAEGTVQVPDGWSVVGDPDYKVGAGEKQSFTLVFTPATVQKYTGDVTYTGNPERGTDVIGEGLAAIAVTTGTVELAGAGETRMGTIHVENRTGAARTLKVTAGSGLQADATAQVPAKGATDVLVQAAGKDEVKSDVTFTGDGLKLDVPVHAAALVIATPILAASGASEKTAAVGTDGMHTAGGQVPAAGQTAALPPDPAGAAGGGGGEAQLNLPPTSDSPEQGLRLPMRPLDVTAQGGEGATISCNFQGATVATCRVEAQSAALDGRGQLELSWTAVDNAAVTIKGDVAAAQLPELKSGAAYTVRLIGLDKKGAIVAVSAPGHIWTAAGAGGWDRRLIGMWTAVAVAVGVGFWWVRRRWF